MRPNPRRYPETGERYIDHGDEHGRGEGFYCFDAANHGPGKCRAEDHEILPSVPETQSAKAIQMPQVGRVTWPCGHRVEVDANTMLTTRCPSCTEEVRG